MEKEKEDEKAVSSRTVRQHGDAVKLAFCPSNSLEFAYTEEDGTGTQKNSTFRHQMSSSRAKFQEREETKRKTRKLHEAEP